MMERFHKLWRLILAVGILNGVVGLGIFFSFLKGNSLENVIAVMLLLSGGISAAYATSLGKGYHKLPGYLMTLLRVGTALIIFFNPLDGNITFTTLIGIFFGLDGALMIGEAMEWKSRKSIYIPAMIGGITSCLFCVLIYSYMKGAAYTTIAELVTVTFLVRAATLVHVAILAKNYKSPVPAPVAQPAAESASEPTGTVTA
jgi:uncharacterized membrane protein HdeD (DUF308 family)